MATIKFQDVREVTVTIPNGAGIAFTDVAPGITNQDGTVVAPDTVIGEMVNGVGDLLYPASVLTPRIGTSVRVYVAKAVNATGDDQAYTVRLTSLRWHSIQGDDHTA